MRYFLIVNPVSGQKKGLLLWEKILPILTSKGAEVDHVISEYNHHPYDIIFDLDFSKYDAIGVLGGDGTMHEVINGMMDRNDQQKLPIALITNGTGNSLMHDLDALDPIKAAKNFVKGHKLKIDLAKISMKDDHLYAFNVIGWGIPVTINEKAEKMRIFGGQRYNVASLIEILRNPSWPVKLQIEQKELQGNYSFFLACNTIYSGNGMRVAPKAKLNDGKFDVLILKKASRPKLIRLFVKIFKGSHINDPIIQYEQVEAFSISDTKDTVLNIDGQAIGSVPFEVKVLKEQVEIFVS